MSKDFTKKQKEEYKRLEKIFDDIPEKHKEVADGLITQASRLKVLLDNAWEDIEKNGEYELFTQSKETPPYERERPISKIFKERDASYQKVIGQLIRLLPVEKVEEVEEQVSSLLDNKS